MTRNFLGIERLRSSGTNGTWVLPVTPRLTTASRFLFGGAALAGAVVAMEEMSGRQVAWSTAQYLDYAMVDEEVEFDVSLDVVGNQITQASVTGHVGDRVIVRAVGALGRRNFAHRHVFSGSPNVPRPDDLRRSSLLPHVARTIHDEFDQRYVIGRGLEDRDGSVSDGRTLMWVRIIDSDDNADSTTLAMFGDFVPLGVGQALGVLGGGNSLDNTLRIVQLVPTKWVLVDIMIHAVERGFGHGSLKMYAEDGSLLAVASQTCIARLWKDRKWSEETA